MAKNYLIPYIPLKGHKDPDFRELSYGDSASRGETLRRNLEEGSYLFFHTRIGDSKYITAYIVIDKIISGEVAQNDPSIKCDGQYDDWLFVGNSKKSKRLRKPLPLNKSIASKLSLQVNFSPYDNGEKTELQVIGSATRSHRELSDEDVNYLINQISRYEENAKIENSPSVQYHMYFYDEVEDIIPFDEVHKIKEYELQKLIQKNPEIIEPGLKLLDYEKVLPDGDRLDLLFESSDKSIIVAELKGPDQLTDSIPTQVASYARDISKEFKNQKIRKMILCDGKISPKLRKACEDLKIELIVYGLKLDCFQI